VAESPVRGVVVGRQAKQKKQTKSEQRAESKFQAAIMAGLLQIALNGLFGSVAILRREQHWQLSPHESEALSAQLNSCLETLPKGSYEQIQKLVERYIPWIGLALTAGAIAGPRIEQSRAAADRASAEAFGNSYRGASSGAEWGRGFTNPYRDGGAVGRESDTQSH